MELPDWVPEGVEVTVPNAARMYDYALGGYHNFAVDREFVDRAEKAVPGARAVGHANRAFVGRSVRWLVANGVRQFLDIGSGIPTLGNVHEVAQHAAPDAKVMYVDIDPVAVAHSQAILAGNPLADVIRADVRGPGDILYHPDVTRLLDFSQPVAVLLNAVLHFVPDSDDPATILTQIREAIVRDSYIAMTHATDVQELKEETEEIRELYKRTPTSVHFRSREQVLDLLTGMDLVEPGIVPVTDWHPDPEAWDDPPQPGILAVVGRKP
ncbi:MAG TPA: SAM-dependent methyltransferase [Pseudonocardiaceae bacterium]|nr:SAM-dependent methyltransferase [Pseudonocardiaceae bacterium]